MNEQAPEIVIVPASPAPLFGCERWDGTLIIHQWEESCEVCEAPVLPEQAYARPQEQASK